MICRILGVVGVLLVSVLAHSILIEGVAHAQEQSLPTLPSSDAKLQADTVFWQTIMASEDPEDFRHYLELFPDGLFAKFARQSLADAKIAVRGRVLLNEHKEDAIFIAARDNDIYVLEWLVAQGADINVRDGYEDDHATSMHYAAQGNAVDAMEWLRAQGADVNPENYLDQTPMHYAAQGNAVDAMEWLKAQGADVNPENYLDQTPIHHAAEYNAVDALEWLVAQGADINVRDGNGETPMHYAAQGNAVDAMEWLKAQGADINVRDSFDLTPMHKAAWANKVAAMEWLKAQGADINALSSGGETLMHNAAAGNSVDAMEWLKAQGADVNARDSTDETPMHFAAVQNAVDAMESLKANGADINARNDAGETPVHWAVRGNAVDAMEWLKAQGADIGAEDKFAQCRSSQIAGGAAVIGGPFELVNGKGETITDKDVITEPALIYFGYTFCPDICPLDMSRNVKAVDILAERGQSVTPVFISIDPDRDTPEAVADFAFNLHERMVALTGTPEQVKAVSKAYKIYYKAHNKSDEYYLVDHSTFTYLVTPEVGFLEFFKRDDTAEQMADKVSCFLDQL